jgi:hypothetical protein
MLMSVVVEKQPEVHINIEELHGIIEWADNIHEKQVLLLLAIKKSRDFEEYDNFQPTNYVEKVVAHCIADSKPAASLLSRRSKRKQTTAHNTNDSPSHKTMRAVVMSAKVKQAKKGNKIWKKQMMKGSKIFWNKVTYVQTYREIFCISWR